MTDHIIQEARLLEARFVEEKDPKEDMLHVFSREDAYLHRVAGFNIKAMCGFVALGSQTLIEPVNGSYEQCSECDYLLAVTHQMKE